MSYRDTKPEYNPSAVRRAGERVRKGNFDEDDIKIIENWRASHNHILNSWQATLRARIKWKKIDFAQRLKRRKTIFHKLIREPKMKLTTMHDIAGCRLIFGSIKELNYYRNSLHRAKVEHIRRKAAIAPYPYDYIIQPKTSGYRGIHDVFEYRARKGRPSYWNRLLVEIQYRTKYQHAWATAVEVAGALTGNHSKFNQGDEMQKEFFRLTSEIIARTNEKQSSCKASLSNCALIKQFNDLENRIHLLRALKGLSIIKQHIPKKERNLILVFSNRGGNKYSVEIFPFESRPEATRAYFEMEKLRGDDDIVQVNAESRESLRSAFRNYFSDAKDFVQLVETGVRTLK